MARKRSRSRSNGRVSYRKDGWPQISSYSGSGHIATNRKTGKRGKLTRRRGTRVWVVIDNRQRQKRSRSRSRRTRSRRRPRRRTRSRSRSRTIYVYKPRSPVRTIFVPVGQSSSASQGAPHVGRARNVCNGKGYYSCTSSAKLCKWRGTQNAGYCTRK